MKRLTLLLLIMAGLALGYGAIEARVSSVTGGGGATAGVSDTAYNATTWDGVTDTAPSKNAVRDKIETISGGDVTDVGDCASGDCDDPYFTEVGGTTIKAGTDGISLVGSNGAVTLLGTGDGEDENLVLDFNSTANTVEITSSTGVTTIDLGTIGITTTGTIDFSGGTTSLGPISSSDWVDSKDYAPDSIDNEHLNWADIDYLDDEGALAANTVDSDQYVDNSIDDAHINWGSGAGQVDLADIPGGTAGANAFDFGGSTSVEIPNGTDPDVDADGEISFDTNDNTLRGYDGSAQVALGMKTKTIHVTVVSPNDLDDATRDKFPVWSNESGFSFIVTKVEAWADTDDTAFVIDEFDADGASNTAEIDGDLNCTTGSGPYTDTETDIANPTVEADHMIFIDFDDTDDPGWVKISISGYFNADVD
jgi:hypothetical protein